jgi:hypothetical protein
MEYPFAGKPAQLRRDFYTQYHDIGKQKDAWREQAEAARVSNRNLPAYQKVEEAQEALRRDPNYKAIPRNPYLGYNINAMDDLVDVVGKHNTGIKFNPTFNSGPAAQEWLDDQIDKAARRGDTEALKRWKLWKVEPKDMDEDPTTINNIVVYSDYPAERIKAIDGFMIAPRSKKEALRAQYDLYPTKELRRDNLADPQEKKKLKAYFRKYSNPSAWAAHPYTDFKVEPTLFNQLKKLYIEPTMTASGFTIKSKNNPTGQISVSHYMFIIQKVMSIAMNTAWSVLIPAIDASTYDFAKDPWKIKTKSRKKILEKKLIQPMTEQDYTRLTTLFPKVDFTGLTVPNIPLAEVICAIIDRVFFVRSGNPDVTLRTGKKIRHSYVLGLVDDINRRSPTGKTELEIVDKVRPGAGAGGGDYYVYKIADYTLTTTRERAETRRPEASGIPKTRVPKNRRTDITQGEESGLSREVVYNSPFKAPKTWSEFDPKQYLQESGLSRIPLRPGDEKDETSSVRSLGSLGSLGSGVLSLGEGLGGFGSGSLGGLGGDVGSGGSGGELSIDPSKKKYQF